MINIFNKVEGIVLQDKFNKNNSYSIGLYKTLNMKNVYKYATGVYLYTLESMTYIKDCDKKFKNKDDAYKFYLELIERYK